MESGTIDVREYRLFRSLDLQRQDTILVADVLDVFSRIGLRRDDARLRETTRALEQYPLRERLSYETFCELIHPNILLVEQALQGKVVIPDFDAFCDEITRIYERTKTNEKGEVADYIPQLAKVDPQMEVITKGV